MCAGLPAGEPNRLAGSSAIPEVLHAENGTASAPGCQGTAFAKSTPREIIVARPNGTRLTTGYEVSTLGALGSE